MKHNRFFQIETDVKSQILYKFGIVILRRNKNLR